MKITSAINMMVPVPLRQNVLDDAIKLLFWFCLMVVWIFLAASLNAEIDKRTAAHSVPTDAVIDRFYRTNTKGHPLFVTIAYPKDPPGGVVCRVDAPFPADPAWFFVGSTIRIVRLSTECDAPLFVDFLPSPGAALMVSLISAAFASALFLIQLFRVSRGEAPM